MKLIEGKNKKKKPSIPGVGWDAKEDILSPDPQLWLDRLTQGLAEIKAYS